MGLLLDNEWRLRIAREFEGGRYVYGRMPSTRDYARPNVSATYSIDLAFLGHRDSVVRVAGGRAHRRAIPPGSGGIHGGGAVEFLRVEGPSEFIEWVPSESMRAEIADTFRAPGLLLLDEVPGITDPVLWSAAVRFRGDALGGWSMRPTEGESVVRALLSHLACVYFNGRRPRANDHRLEKPELHRLRDFIEAFPADRIKTAELARLVHRSPYQFIRSFRATTGLRPHEYILSVKMTRMRAFLSHGLSVETAADRVGFRSGHSLRRAFKRCFGALPSESAHHSPQAQGDVEF